MEEEADECVLELTAAFSGICKRFTCYRPGSPKELLPRQQPNSHLVSADACVRKILLMKKEDNFGRRKKRELVHSIFREHPHPRIVFDPNSNCRIKLLCPNNRCRRERCFEKVR